MKIFIHSIRRVAFAGAMAAFAMTAFLAASDLYSTTSLTDASRRIAADTATLYRIVDVERLLLLYSRELHFAEATDGTDEGRERQQELLRQLDANMKAVRDDLRRGEQQALAVRMEGRIHDYLAQVRRLRYAELPVSELIARLGPDLDAALAATRELRATQAEHLRRLGARESSLRTMANGTALATSLAVLLLGFVFQRVVKKDVLEPLTSLKVTIDRFRDGDHEARSGRHRLAELNAVSRRLDGLLETIRRSEETRLASLGAVAHDLRNPLGTLRLSLEGLQDASPIPEARLKRSLETALRQVERLTRMVSDLLDAVRIRAGKLELKTARIDLREPVRQVVREYRLSVSDAHPIESDLPGEAVVVAADFGRICQVVENLLSNAVKYSPEGGPVDVRLRVEDGTAVLSVSDEGIGIAEDDQERIFQPFLRVTHGDGLEGVGLGLSVSRELVRAQGGELGVESTPGSGSTFSVRLPLASREERDPPPIAP